MAKNFNIIVCRDMNVARKKTVISTLECPVCYIY
jgi:hypothetical protein